MTDKLTYVNDIDFYKLYYLTMEKRVAQNRYFLVFPPINNLTAV